MNTNLQLQERLSKIDIKLENIEAGIRRNDIHNVWVIKVYLMIKEPVIDLFRYIGMFKIKEKDDKYGFIEV